MLKTFRRPTPKLPLKFLMWNTPLGHGVTPPRPPDFGPSRFTPQQQAANPDKPLTRVIKDILHVGSAKVGFDENGNAIPWNVTPQTLTLLNSTSKERMQIGDAINLGKGHGDEDLIIHSDDLICPIDEVKLANGVLWLSSYVTPEQKKYLLNPAMKVSVGVVRDYVAGDMTHGEKRYPLALVHVAVTDRPAQLKQGPFLALANSTSSLSPKGSKVLDFQALIEVLNKLLKSMGLELLPPDTNENNLVELIQARAAGDEATTDDPNVPMSDVAMCNRISKSRGIPFDQVWATMPKTDSPLRLSNAESLPNANWPVVTLIQQLLKLLKQPMLPTNTNDQTLEANLQTLLSQIRATPQPAPVAMANRQRQPSYIPLSDDEVAERLKSQGIDPKYMPRLAY